MKVARLFKYKKFEGTIMTLYYVRREFSLLSLSLTVFNTKPSTDLDLNDVERNDASNFA